MSESEFEIRLKTFEEKLQYASQYFAGYPDNLNYDYSTLLPFFSYSMINAGDPFVTTDWDLHSKVFEREVIEWFAELYGLSPCWGYVSSGGTESNLQGMFLGREMYPDGVLYFSSETHYSIPKAAYMMNTPRVVIPALASGEIDCAALQESLAKHADKPAIVNLNIGTTMQGAIDDIERVCQLLSAHTSGFYLHCDAALSGMLVPFLENAPSLSFDRYPIHSLAVSGNKFVGAPIPHGVILARPNIVEKVGLQVDYIGCKDSTLLGVRSGLATLCLWYAIHTRGEHFSQEAQGCVERAQYLQKALQDHGIPAQLNAFSNTVVLPCPSQTLCRRWQLATQNNYAHIVVMQHLDYPKLDELINDLQQDTLT